MTTRSRNQPIVTRLVVWTACILLAGCATTAPGPEPVAPREPERFRYHPFSETYTIVSHTRQEQDLGGQSSTVEYALHWHLTASWDPAGGEAGLKVTIDSIPSITGGNPGLNQGDLTRAAGTTFLGALSPDGRVTGLQGGDTANTFVQQLAQSVERFFPRVPLAGAAPGEVWSDTLATTTQSGGLELQLEFVSRSEAGSWAERGGVRTVDVSTATAYTVVGGGTQMGTEIDLEGTGTRHAVAYLAADGRFLGGTSADTSNLTATVAAMGMVIPIVQMRYDTVTVVR